MTTENKSIWHTPDEIPEECKDLILVRMDGRRLYGRYVGSIIHEYGTDYAIYPEKFIKWAYIDDLVSASKALDVARSLLRNIELFGDDDSDRARAALDVIDKIMKGDK